MFKQDCIKDRDKAKAQFRLIDGTLFSLGKETELIIDEYQFKVDASNAVFELTKGVFRAVTGVITNRDDPKFKVITPIGSIGIRDTDFWGGYLEEEKVYVLFISGNKPILVENEFGNI